MSQSRTRLIRTLVAFIGLAAVLVLVSACTHWGGHGGGHHAKQGAGYGNCQSVVQEDAERLSSYPAME